VRYSDSSHINSSLGHGHAQMNNGGYMYDNGNSYTAKAQLKAVLSAGKPTSSQVRHILNKHLYLSSDISNLQ
jgi:hypothetical protein